MTLNAIDVSSNQPADITAKVDYDIAIVKATGNPSGTGWAWDYENPYFEQQMEGAIARGKLVGCYHFSYGLDSPEREARKFCDLWLPYQGRAVPILDFEGPAVHKCTVWAKRWCDWIIENYGVRPMVYAGASDIKRLDLVSFCAANNLGLWSANYWRGYERIDGFDTTGCVNDVPSAAMWQFTSSGYLPGYDGNLDLNIFYGDAAAWKAYAKGSAPAKPDKPDTGKPTVKGKTVDQLAAEVLAGKWGIGAQRRKNLGKLYNGVQAVIDRELGYEPDYGSVADDVIAGVYGNNPNRQKVLGSIYDRVQAIVNSRY